MNLEENVTICIKTFLRKKSLWALLSSIEVYYPKLQLIIVDDSIINYKNSTLRKFPNLNINYITTSFDIGVSEGRNILLKNVNTEFFLLCDDDFQFNQNTNLKVALKTLVENKQDILGGELFEEIELNSFYEFLRWIKWGRNLKGYKLTPVSDFSVCKIEGSVLIKEKMKYNKNESFYIENLCFVSNFFIARTSSIEKIGGWRHKSLKLGEHGVFFDNAYFGYGLKIAYTNLFSAKTIRYSPLWYIIFRLRPGRKFRSIFKSDEFERYQSMGIKKIKFISYDGSVQEIDVAY